MASIEPCPHCGRDGFGNAGARTQHVRSCERKAEQYQQNQQPEPQTLETVDNTQEATAPARQEDVSTAGEQLASGIASAVDEDAPVEERKGAIKQLTSLTGGLVSGLMEHKEQKKRQAEQRARNANVEKVEDKPQCECGATFAAIPPNAERVQCPECGREYRVQ